MNDETPESEVLEPEILEAEWDLGQVNALFDDLRRGAIIHHVQVRSTSGHGLGDQAVTLDQSQELLARGEAKAIQIRYEFDQKTWCDTLMVGPESIRVIRTQS